MIASLEDAWKWYQSVKSLTVTMDRLGAKHWDDLPWESRLGRDNHLARLESAEILEQTQRVSGDLDDLGVLLLFSVFEALVRQHALETVTAELNPLSPLSHPALLHAIKGLTESLEHGSFAKVLEAYKTVDADLVEEVNQVRRYRNWVAHGRRNEPRDAVQPQLAYLRLQRFLDLLK